MRERAARVGQQQEDVAAEGQHVDLLGDGRRGRGRVDVGHQAGVPVRVVVAGHVSGGRAFAFVGRDDGGALMC